MEAARIRIYIEERINKNGAVYKRFYARHGVDGVPIAKGRSIGGARINGDGENHYLDAVMSVYENVVVPYTTAQDLDAGSHAAAASASGPELMADIAAIEDADVAGPDEDDDSDHAQVADYDDATDAELEE